VEPVISVRFLGTGGARFTVARQIRASGGMWMRFGATQIHVDPGPGALVRALSVIPPCNPVELDAIVLSHKHLDHANDVNIMVEAMSQGGYRPRGALFAPRDAFEGEAVIFPYVRKFVKREEFLVERSGPYAINDVELRTSIKHIHSVETFGMHFRYAGRTVSYLPCGRFFAGLIEDYKAHDPDVLIVNVLRYSDSMDVDHLLFEEARRIVTEIRPRVAVFTHFGTRLLERDPDRLAAELEDELGIRVHAARDGWMLDVETEVASVVN